MANYLDKSGLLRVLRGVKNQIERKVGELETTKGRPNGIASLDENGNVPLSQLGNVDTDIHEIALVLPTQLTEKQSKHIFLVPRGVDEKTNKNIYKEYIFTGSDITNVKDTDWEQLGEFTTSVDLKDYSKKSETISDIRFTDMDVDGCWTSNTILNNLLFEFADGKQKIISIPLASGPYYGTAHQSPGGPGFMSGEDKVKLDKIDLNALTTSITAANTAADNTNEAIRKCETATTGAEKCNVEMVGSKISVTDRNGETKSIDVIGPGENVVVYITSSVEGLSVVGLKINVYLNNGKTPQTYTTDSEGVAKFEVDRGNYYEVAFPEFGNAQPITPVGFTSVLGARDIRVEYKPYSMDETEEATVSVMKYDEGNGTAFAGAKVSVTIGGETNEYTADEYGKVFVYVPYGKDYTVTVKDQDAYFVRYAKNSRTYTAKLPKRSIVYTMYQYKTGILVVDDSLNEYYIDDWLADGRSPDDAVAIRVAEQQLLLNGGSFLFRVSDLKNLSKLPTRKWCTQSIQFNSIALNGNSVKDENYYRGETSTFLIRQEAEERSISVPAFDYAWNQELVIGNQHLRGFIMSVGQEYIHIANQVEIGEVLRKLFDDEIADTYLAYVTSKDRWTSTQGNATNAWSYSSQAYSYIKDVSCYVLPVFAC